MSVIEIRKGQAPAKLARAEFGERFRQAYFDPFFRVEDQSIARLEEIAWQIYLVGRKAPFTQKAGPGYADPDYELSIEWLATKQRIEAAQRQWSDAQTPVNGGLKLTQFSHLQRLKTDTPQILCRIGVLEGGPKAQPERCLCGAALTQ